MRVRNLVMCLAAAAAIALLARPGVAQTCVGDCDGSGDVAINELVIGVNILLEQFDISRCPSFDANGGGAGAVEINELVLGVLNVLNGCPEPTCTTEGGTTTEISPGPDAEEQLLTALIEAQPHDVIVLKAGTYDINSQLSLTVDDVTIRGEGMDETILSFRNQSSGAEGLLVRADRFLLEDLALEDEAGPPFRGDLFKIEGCNGVTVRRVRAEWTNGAATDNGAYGLYPVQCKNVLIEDSIVKGASDAGIYVGQSRNIVVRRNHVESNVAGIEIENSFDADVFENTATHNTGGILVFNLPDPPVQKGSRTRVFNNQIIENNTVNFAPEGNTVAGVPDGTGMLILANDQVEIFGNTFRDNNTSSISVVSYRTAAAFGIPASNNPYFDAFTETILIAGNTYEGGGDMPDPDLEFLAEPNILNGLPFPNIILDGDEDPDKLEGGALPAGLRVCVQEENATLVDLDVPGGFAGLSRDASRFDCTHERLPAINIPEPRSVRITPGPNAQEDILNALIGAEPGDVITLAKGQYDLTGPLSLSVDDVTLRGEGVDCTTLNFSQLEAGAEGLFVDADRFTLEDLALEDGPDDEFKGDLFKAIGSNGVTVRNVRAEWTEGSNPDNGSYAFYPVQCSDVVIEDSIVRGASDAGIYVGQSDNIIVRRNRVEFNVAGIEIENSTNADVYDNFATNNTAGILVFNLPGLPVTDGHATRVFRNRSVSNNTPNFAPGGIVQGVPAGTGMMILANDQVEIFNNTFTDNGTTHLFLLSYNTVVLLGSAPEPTDPEFDAYSESVFVFDNEYEGGGDNPDASVGEALVGLAGSPIPQIVTDGWEDEDKLENGMLPAELRQCVQEDGATFVDLDLANLTAEGGPNVSHDITAFNCSQQRLPAVAIPGVR